MNKQHILHCKTKNEQIHHSSSLSIDDTSLFHFNLRNSEFYLLYMTTKLVGT